ncbi:MAG: Jag N-terminal domain-containing protein [Synergistaceae bacterium]|nr:Jag N-terminal domain-containing protein [Synergistaceae bacterium]
MEQDTHLVIEAASVEDAVEQASRQWGVPVDKLRTEVVGTEKSFFGLFGKKLKVRVEPEKPLLLLKSSVFLSELLGRMELRAAPELSEGNYTIGIEGQDADILVGRYGDGLKAMEYLLNLALRSPGEDPRLRLDSGGYRERRVKSLERLAEATARRVVQRGAPLRLEPMLSWERWVIHTTLKDRDDVETQSVGEAPDRKVVVMPKLGAAERSESTRPGVAGNRASRSRYRR